MDQTPYHRTALLDWFKSMNSCVVAFSGGLDSTVVAKAASLVLGGNTVAVMAIGPTCYDGEIEEAETVAAAIPIRFVSFSSFEMRDDRFISNDLERCYYCKKIRFKAIREYADSEGIDAVLDGSNADDQSDYRPGRRAVEEFGLRSPLAELGFGKETVRQLARFWKLPNSEKPASPCLATRLAYGLTITEDRLRRIEAAENILRSMNFSPVRVRLHPDELVRIEVPQNRLEEFLDSTVRTEIVDEFRRLGFRRISLDLEGFCSGSMNPF